MSVSEPHSCRLGYIAVREQRSAGSSGRRGRRFKSGYPDQGPLPALASTSASTSASASANLLTLGSRPGQAALPAPTSPPATRVTGIQAFQPVVVTACWLLPSDCHFYVFRRRAWRAGS